MRTTFLIFVVSISFASNLNAQNGLYIKLGRNISEFRNGETELKKGLSLGVGYRYEEQTSRYLNGFVNVEILYTTKNGVIKNKTWPVVGGIGLEPEGALGDIDISLGYLEIPLNIGYSLNVRKKAKIGSYIGASFSLPIINNSRKIYRKYFLLDDNRTKLDYERYEPDDSDPPVPLEIVDTILETDFYFDIGANVSWSFINLDLRYIKAINAIRGLKEVVRLDIHEKIDTFTLSIGIEL